MASSDYEIRGQGGVTPSARLTSAIGPASVLVSIAGLSSSDNSIPLVGQAVMVDDEFMVIEAVELPVLTVGRGCADTVPRSHSAGAKLWIFTTNGMGSDDREYAAGGTIGVKVLMKSTGQSMGVENSPPNALTFNQRFARPYPPGNVQVNSKPFGEAQILGVANPNIVLTWAHRNRVSQGDQMVSHAAGDVTPETGTTYTLRIYDGGGTLKRTIAGITGTTTTYPVSQAVDDLTGGGGYGSGTMRLCSVRDGLESFQQYVIDFSVNANDYAEGWGVSWGAAWGN